MILLYHENLISHLYFTDNNIDINQNNNCKCATSYISILVYQLKFEIDVNYVISEK